jgi:hypothetical protein
MKRLIADGTLVTKTLGTGKTSRIVVDLERSRLPVESAGVVTVREAAEHLGLPVSVLQHLRDAGVFEVQPRRGSEASWHEDDVQKFLRRGLAMSDVSSSVGETVKLKDVMRLKLRDAKAKADIVAAMFDGRLTVAGRAGQSLGGIRLDRRQLDEFVLQKRAEVERDTYSLPEAAGKTGLDPAVISHAIDSGLLVGVRCADRVRISGASIDHFNREYEAVASLAAKLRTTTRRLLRKCRENGIRVTLLRRAGRSADQPLLHRSSVLSLTQQWESELAGEDHNRKAYRERNYESAMRKYLQELEAQGRRLPRHAGEPNKIEIGKACGFHRNILYSHPSVIALLESFDKAERQRLGKYVLDPLAALEQYLSRMRASGTPLPRGRGNEPSRQAIAKECGFDRKLFYTEPAAAALLRAHMSPG